LYISESPTVQRVEYVRGRIVYIVLEGGWCGIIIWNLQAPSEDKSDNSKDSFYDELEQVFDYIPKYCMQICYEILVKLWREKMFQTDNWE
jgi:hypothetical protein